MANDAHLHNAAATLRAILTAKHPEHTWIVEVRPRKQATARDETDVSPSPCELAEGERD